ncbi:MULTISPECIES: N-acetyltransferase [unclassified Neorhizobium]|uniref:GNAT family N-acetyltransferase n=1 Tax=unclassified Neorhizobium TaxID=2629175 RepID=UPI001FF55400|nr:MULTISPECIES: GNAT family N-acetyltransferase [unclassified Neorhizobium]MCJ9671595.1 GNAT family N-acetyltransferase [Neorhizobium sp. SHOUNA12B]MCJ9747724.1 GNAT family N-acetyltransferase [Neorhizobium sp. SHOUNA12A]
MPNISLKLGSTRDIRILHPLLIETILSTDIYDARARRAEAEKYSAKYLEELAGKDEHSIILSWDGDRISGFLITRPDDDILWLCWFGVFPRYRGKGIGEALIRDMLERARQRGVHKIWCDTRASNRYSIAIMQRNGFKNLCELKNHWFNQDYLLWETFPDGDNSGNINDDNQLA